ARARLAAGDVGNPALADRMREVEIWCLEGWRFHQIAGADRGTGSELGQFDLAIGVVAGDWSALPDGLGSVAQRGRAGAGPTEVVILHQLARSAMRETEPLPQRAREVRDRLSTLIAAEPGLAGLKIAFGSFADGDDLERQVTSVLGSWIARQMRGETGAEPPPRPAGAHEVAPGPAANDGRGPGQTAKPRGGVVKPAPAASARRALKLAPATPGQPRQTRQARLLTQPLRLGIGGVKPPVVMPPRAAAPKPPPDGDGRGPAGTGRNAGNAPAPPLAPNPDRNPDRNPDAGPDAGPDRQFPPHPGAKRDPATEMPRSPGPAHAPQHGAVPGRGTPPFSDDGRATPTEAAPPRTAPLTAPPTPPLPNPGDRPTGAGQARDSTPSGRGEHERRKLSIASWPAALASAMADPPNAPQQRVEPGSAYPGQRAFRTEEAALFFGREGAVDDALTRLAEARQRGTAFLLVEGASGVGKTSFVEAGLIPRLATARPVPRIARMAAGAAPFLELASTLVDAGALPDDDETPDRLRAELATWLERGGDAVALLRTSNTLQGPADSPLSERGEAAPTRLVLVVDALERLEQAGVPARTRSALMHQFGQLARAPGMLVIASARRGATAHDAELLALALAGARFELSPLDAPGLEAAMRRPARAARLSFGRGPSGDGLDRALLADAEGPGALAHLADALGRLATQAGGRHDEPPWRLAEPDYAEMGGLAGLAARAAERAVVALDGEAQAALPRLLAQLADPVEDEAADGAAETEREPDMPRYRHRRGRCGGG
ncbi:MAG: ATP-binding protein, partial [Pseudomonadota bacterium]